MRRRSLPFFAISTSTVLVLLAAMVSARTTTRDSVYKYLTVFAEVISLVKNSYVEPTESHKLMRGAFSGLTDAMDPFSYFVAKQDRGRYDRYVAEKGPGVGLVIAKRFGLAYVISPIAGSPAAEAGIEAGDFVQSIDGKGTREMDLWEIRSALRGKAGSKTTLAVVTDGFLKREEKTLVRAQVFTPEPTLAIREGVAVVRIPYFGEGTAKRVRALLEQARARQAGKLLLDLRDNPGGVTQEAIEVARLVVPSGLLARLAGRTGPKREWRAEAREVIWQGEVAVLANGASAQAPEVLAAAIRDNKRGILLGETTYGKGVHQRFVKLATGGGLYLTVAKYYTPGGKALQGKGLEPDVEITGGLSESGPDRVLEKALEALATPRSPASA